MSLKIKILDKKIILNALNSKKTFRVWIISKKLVFFLLSLILFFLTACTPKTFSVDLEDNPQLFFLHSTSSTENWIPQIYSCADRTRVGLVARTPDLGKADISLRIGPAENGYLIDEVDLVVVGNAENPLSSLTQTQIASIFTGEISNWVEVGGDDAQIALWVYDDEQNDIQIVFNEKILEGSTLSTMAYQAQNPDKVRAEIAKDKYALGIISQAEMVENLRILYSFEKIPVLAVVKEDAQESVFLLIKCLQGE